jgi:hypothetical protein
MNSEELQLWEKISQFPIDKTDVKLSFSQRLARANGFSESFARKIVEEYKKFLFLCCVSEQPVTPSNFVDLAWHLHLTYTKSYWNDLCENTLQQEIHHTPTEGGKFEKLKYKSYYEYTLELYKTKFNENPDFEIWEKTQNRFELNFINVDKRNHWIIPKINLSKSFRVILGLILSSIFLVSCTSSENHAIIIVAIAFMIIGFFSFVNRNRDRSSSSDSSSSGFSASFSGDSGGDHHDSNHDSDGDHSSDGDGGNDGGSDGGGDSGCSGCGGGGD